MFEITDFRESDKGPWARIWSSYEEGAKPKEVILKAINKNWPRIMNDKKCHAHALRVVETKEAVGFITYATFWCAFSDKDDCYISGLFVLPEWRKKGGASMLMNAVMEFAKANNMERVYWMTRSNHTEAIAMYDKLAEAQDWIRYKVDI